MAGFEGRIGLWGGFDGFVRANVEVTWRRVRQPGKAGTIAGSFRSSHGRLKSCQIVREYFLEETTRFPGLRPENVAASRQFRSGVLALYWWWRPP